MSRRHIALGVGCVEPRFAALTHRTEWGVDPPRDGMPCAGDSLPRFGAVRQRREARLVTPYDGSD